MAFALVKNGIIAEIDASRPLVIDDVQYTLDVLSVWSVEQLATIGVYKIIESDITEWKRVSTASLIFIDGNVTRVVSLEYIPLSERKEEMCASVRKKRWQVETNGLSLQNGTMLITDRDSQAKITGAVALFENDQTLASIDWEAQPGVWISVDRATMLGMGVIVGRHVQQCYSHSRQLIESIIAASSHGELDAIDISAGWPAQ